jgi:tRNA threonylcarbamoyladenosine biosynthesis protein TsaE
METKITVNHLGELEDFVQNFVATLTTKAQNQNGSLVVALSGDLGAGKTTLVQALARCLGITEVVTSPTFTIMKSYQIIGNESFSLLVHMDAYRLESLAELKPLRFDEVLANPKNLVCVEWAEKIAPVLPKDTIYLKIEIKAEDSREITITNTPRVV